MNERYLSGKRLSDRAGISPADMKKIIAYDNSVASTADGVPIFKLMEVLNKAFQSSVGTNRIQGEEGYSLANEMQHEKVMKERIANQVKLGIFMKKEEASTRTMKFAVLLNNLVKYAITNTSNYLVQHEMCENVREAEIFLTHIWNGCIDFVMDNAVVLDWEEDGQTLLTRTRLQTLKEIDNENEPTNLSEGDEDGRTI